MKTRTKKPYRPRYGDQAEMAQRLAGKLEYIADTNRPISQEVANTLELKMTAALDALIEGGGEVEHMATLTCEVSLCARACELNFAGSAQYLAIALAARDALESAGRRHLRIRRWGLAGTELQSIRDVIELRSALYNHPDNTVGFERRLQADVEAAIRKGNYVRFIVEEEPSREAVAA